jgi:colicin import membrane protein
VNAQAKIIEAEPSEITELAVIPRETALSVLTDAEQFDAFYAKVKAVVDAHVPDVSTPKGREAIKALAFKVVKSKTAIDAAGKMLTEEWRTQTQKVDAARKAIRDKLDALRDEARRPVTEWEEAEEARVERVKAALADLQAGSVISVTDTSDTLDVRLAAMIATRIDEAEFQEYAPAARAHREAAIQALTAGIERLAKEEADRAELQRLRDEAAARERAEAARIAAEAAAREEAERAERAAAEAEARQAAEVERQRVAAEQAEAARVAREAQAKADAEAAAARREAEAARAETERLQAAERQRQEAERAAQARAAAAQAEEDRKAAGKAHRSKIMGEVKRALMGVGLTEEPAKAIVNAIVAGTIPHTTIKF